jgi:predicted membrane protein
MEMDEKQKDDSKSEAYVRAKGNGRMWAGLFLLAIGGVLLLDQMGFPFPDWLFSWHVLLVAIGLFVGFRHNFRGGGWLALILVGCYFMAQDNFPQVPFHRFIGPIVIIGVAMMMLLRPHRQSWRHYNWRDEQWGNRGGRHSKQEWKQNKEEWKQKKEEWKNKWRERFDQEGQKYSSADMLDATNIFGGVHRNIVSKNFRGGDVTTFMGGTEINLAQADINGTVVLDVTQVMGGTKIIVPTHWEVRSEMSAVFAGFEDKRQQPVAVNPDKVLVIRGTSVFGGIELRNF